MQVDLERNIVLAIETAVRGGSLSVLKNGSQIDYWTGESNSSGAEEILDRIRSIFERNFIEGKSVGLIAVAAGSGSSTGIKIGAAIARGLAKAFNCQTAEVSILQALLSKLFSDDFAAGERILTAMPVGRNLIARQSFKRDSSSNDLSLWLPGAEIEISDFEEFSADVASGRYSQAVLHNVVFRLFETQTNYSGVKIIDAGINIAKLIGKSATTNATSVRV